MPHDYIYDDDGQNVAWIDSGNVFSVATKKKVAVVREGNICTLEGQIIGHLQDAGRVRQGGETTPKALMELLKAS